MELLNSLVGQIYDINKNVNLNNYNDDYDKK